MAALQDRQLELIERMAALDPPPWFMGGRAEDAVLAGEATRPHDDVDWLLRRRELDERLAQAARFGFETFETWGESTPLRAGIASIGSFGPLSERQQQAMEHLRERFFPERTPAELVPEVEPLPW